MNEHDRVLFEVLLEDRECMLAKKRQLTLDLERIETEIGDLMGQYRYENVERHKRVNRKTWDPDLWKAVVRSRRFDQDGELVEESELDKVRHVWNLGAPRKLALEERRQEVSGDPFDVSEWCVEEEREGWTLKIVGDRKGAE